MGSSEMDPVEFRKFLDMMENVKQQTEQNDKPADIHSVKNIIFFERLIYSVNIRLLTVKQIIGMVVALFGRK